MAETQPVLLRVFGQIAFAHEQRFLAVKGGWPDHPPQVGDATPRTAYTPLKVASAWLVGTWLSLVVVGNTSLPWSLSPQASLVAIGGVCALTLGYVSRVRLETRRGSFAAVDSRDSGSAWRATEVLIKLSVAWTFGFWLAIASYRGMFAPSEIIQSLLSPADSYDASYRLAEAAVDGGPITRVIYATAGFMPYLPILLPSHWRRLGVVWRVASAASLLSVIVTSAATGVTLVPGLYALLLLVGFGLSRGRRQAHPLLPQKVSSSRRRRGFWIGLSIVVVFLSLFVFQRIDRLDTSRYTRMTPIAEWVSTYTGRDFGHSLDSTLSYANHGYIGLSLALQQPFIFTDTYGSSRAANFYLSKLGLPDQSENRYPERVERSTGYSSTQTWSTAYAELASDLTFPGVVLLMFVFGRAWARTWYESVWLKRRVASGLFGLGAVFIAFLPANNIVGNFAPLWIALVTNIAAYGLVLALKRRADPRRVRKAVNDRARSPLESSNDFS